MAMFGARMRAQGPADLSWLFPNAPQPAPVPGQLSWLFPDGVPRADNGPDPFGYNPPFVPPETLPAAGHAGTLSQRCLAALQVTHKSPDDVARVEGLMPVLRPAAAPHSIDPRMLGAMALHESAGRNIGEIGRGKGMGVFQLTNQPIRAAQAYNIPFAADYAANMLAEFRRTLSRRAPNFTTDQLNQAMAAAYNKGPNKKGYRITNDPATIDRGTDHQNYGQNILDLMDCFSK